LPRVMKWNNTNYIPHFLALSTPYPKSLIFAQSENFLCVFFLTNS
jgi:hypothetical protein